jgi:hypothetical protein
MNSLKRNANEALIDDPLQTSNADEVLNADEKVIEMKPLTLLKNLSDETFNASLPRFIASSLSTLYESMLLKSPCNNEGFSGIRESKVKQIWLCY